MNSGLGNISAVKLIWSPQVMRGVDFTQEALFTTVHLDTFVPKDHPLRAIKSLFDQALTGYWMEPIPNADSC